MFGFVMGTVKPPTRRIACSTETTSLDAELAAKASSVLGYTGATTKIKRAADQKHLEDVLAKLDIKPFVRAEVETYKAAVLKKSNA